MSNLNKRIHSQIRKHVSNDEITPYDYSELDIDKLIEDTNAEIWQAICILTQSISECCGKSPVSDQSSKAYQSKKVRRFYLLCLILFCTNDRCSIPLHTLIADIVDSQGGSNNLSTILNRLGICSSSETLKRHTQHRVGQKDVHRHMSPDSMTVISADNIDWLLSFSMCGKDAKSSWHGTSVQAVQPLPSLSEITDDVRKPMSSGNDIQSLENLHELTSHDSEYQPSITTQSIICHPTDYTVPSSLSYSNIGSPTNYTLPSKTTAQSTGEILTCTHDGTRGTECEVDLRDSYIRYKHTVTSI